MSVASQIRKAKKFENLGEFDVATDTYKTILCQFPQNNEAKKGLKRIQQALVRSNSLQAPDRNPESVITPALRDKLWDMHLAKDYYKLLGYIEKYLSYNPEDYELLFLAGSCCRHTHDFHKAMDYLKKALAHEPENFGANLEVARIFADSGLVDLAKKTFEHIIGAYKSKFEAHLEYGKWLVKNNEHEKALSLYSDALIKFPERYEFISHLGECYFALAQYPEAHESFTRAMDPQRRAARLHTQMLHANRMNAAAELGWTESLNESIPEVENLIAENPKSQALSGTPKFNLALHYLRTGNIEKGWQYYRDRFERINFPSPKRKFEKPRVNSLNDLADQTVLIWREQGVGDEIIFYNLLNQLLEKTDCKYLVECEPRLVTVLQRSFPEVQFRPEQFCPYTLTSPNDDFDAHFPLGDLPTLLNVTPQISKTLKPWVKIDIDIDRNWRETFPSEKLNIGFAWESGFKNKRRNYQYISIDFFDELISRSNDNWICLQYTANEDDIQLLKKASQSKVFLPEIDLKNDFENVSAIIKNCDIIITPRTAVLSLSAAVGCPSATFRAGASAPMDLGVSMGPGSVSEPPLLPKSSLLHLDYGITEDVKRASLMEFFSEQINKVRLTKFK